MHLALDHRVLRAARVDRRHSAVACPWRRFSMNSKVHERILKALDGPHGANLLPLDSRDCLRVIQLREAIVHAVPFSEIANDAIMAMYVARAALEASYLEGRDCRGALAWAIQRVHQAA